MKNLITSLFVMLFTASAAYSQSDNADIDIVQAVFGKTKRLIIEQNMQLDGQEKQSFWPLYDQYEERRKTIERKGFLLLKEYANKFETLNDAEAHKLIVNYMSTMDEYCTLHKVYFKKMEKHIGSLKAAKFIQLETFMQTTSQANLQSQVPIIGELGHPEQQTTEQKLEN